MNFKVVVKKETKPSDIRYYESESLLDNMFLLKYFKFECALCQRLCSHIWTGNCQECRDKIDPDTKEILNGICHECCTQI